jgi:hypothetical protein
MSAHLNEADIERIKALSNDFSDKLMEILDPRGERPPAIVAKEMRAITLLMTDTIRKIVLDRPAAASVDSPPARKGQAG